MFVVFSSTRSSIEAYNNIVFWEELSLVSRHSEIESDNGELKSRSNHKNARDWFDFWIFQNVFGVICVSSFKGAYKFVKLILYL